MAAARAVCMNCPLRWSYQASTAQRGWAERKCKRVWRAAVERVPLQLQLATTIKEVWSMDFVSDSLANGRRLKCLTLATTSDTSASTSWWASVSSAPT
jgi:hypothetical protein